MSHTLIYLQWFKMGAESIILSRQSVYVIQVANLSHSGTYTCRASNQEGQSEDSTIVVVSMYTPPPPTTAPATTTQPATTTTSPPTTTVSALCNAWYNIIASFYHNT